MLHFGRWTIFAIVATCLAAIVLTLPNFFAKQTVQAWPSWLPRQQMPLGLDLRGGAHLLLEMDTAELTRDWLATIREDARRQLRESKIAFSALGFTPTAVQVRLAKPEDTVKAVADLRKIIQPIGNVILGTSGNDVTVEQSEPGVIIVQPTATGLQQRISDATGAAIETVRKRVDPSGTVEATVIRQGTSRILVQVPGVEDTKQLKARIGETAKLTFHSVHPQTSAEEAKLGRVPSGHKIFPSVEANEGDYLLVETPIVSGEDLVDAQPAFDQQTNEPIISFRFNQSGARKFGRFTQNNVGAPFAIVLDGKVLSAPVIREAILGGSGQISGSFTVQTANDLAIQLRSGALPAKLTIVEERTVGPSLGADSLEAGLEALVLGFVGVLIFMTAAYGVFGLFAVIALVVNILLITAALSVMQATLTLPGIAGIVLTMGMSVDANVLINERIRDEIRIGKTPISALDTGFSRAYGTIFDTNMTGLLAALILIAFGSGPVRGFGVTLAIGIVASAFTATTITRYLVAVWYRWARPKVIPI